MNRPRYRVLVARCCEWTKWLALITGNWLCPSYFCYLLWMNSSSSCIGIGSAYRPIQRKKYRISDRQRKHASVMPYFFPKNLNQRSLTPRWPLTPCLLRSHVWLYPRIIVSKSHGNTSMYVDTVINFANYHIHTHTHILHTYYVQNEWSHSLLLNSVQARQQGVVNIFAKQGISFKAT